ncbi:MAG: ribonuclease HII [Elusimicrobiota bacterium]|jgi:ribonuclease HII|nr:ribonuclease HII [Elusimicrobiota bacterium]
MTLADFDRDAQRAAGGAAFIVGVDEAGRGPLAGPVCAAACHIPPALYGHAALQAVNDSKKLTPLRRAKIYAELINLPIICCVGYASAAEVDRVNILQATFLAMSRALAKFNGQNIFALVDGNHKIPQIGRAQRAVVGGDAKSLCVAAASILAKVSRDNYMQTAHALYPHYGFEGHKGYGTQAHIEAVRKHGPCREHRRTFEPVATICGGLF